MRPTPPTHPILIAHLHELLAELARSGLPATGPLTASAGDTTWQVNLTIAPTEESSETPAPASAPTSTLSASDGGTLSPVQRQILSVATNEPQTAPRLARAAGRSCNTHFRDALRELVRRGLLVHLPEGYRLPASSLP